MPRPRRTLAYLGTILGTRLLRTRLLGAMLLAASFSSTDASADLTHRVVVQPVVVQRDKPTGRDGWRLPERRVDLAFAAGGVDVHFLEPVYLDRDVSEGGGNNDAGGLVQRARAAGLLRAPDWIVSLFFLKERSDDSPVVRRAPPGDGVALVLERVGENEGDLATSIVRELARALGVTNVANDSSGIERLTGIEAARRWVRPRFACLDRSQALAWITNRSNRILSSCDVVRSVR